MHLRAFIYREEFTNIFIFKVKNQFIKVMNSEMQISLKTFYIALLKYNWHVINSVCLNCIFDKYSHVAITTIKKIIHSSPPKSFPFTFVILLFPPSLHLTFHSRQLLICFQWLDISYICRILYEWNDIWNRFLGFFFLKGEIFGFFHSE